TEPAGRIEIHGGVEDECITLRVRDNGIGMDADLVTRVFDLFTQARSEVDRSQGGLGIGLTLVHNLVKMHDGDVVAHSEGAGQGSEFTIRLPPSQCDEVTEVESAPRLKPTTQAKRVLVVDDNQDAAEMLAEL